MHYFVGQHIEPLTAYLETGVVEYLQVNVLPARDNPMPLPPAPDNMVKTPSNNQFKH
jgi:hypothetical protein